LKHEDIIVNLEETILLQANKWEHVTPEGTHKESTENLEKHRDSIVIWKKYRAKKLTTPYWAAL
jgi:hypothetical protein